MLIYKATNIINGKIYIGQTKQAFAKRRQQHENSVKYKSCDKMVFTRAIKKYGKENFKWDVIDTAKNQEELDAKEIYWIKHFKTLVDTGLGYNSNKGGEGGSHSETTKRKIGDAQMGEANHMFGVKGEDNQCSKPVVNITDNIQYVSATECADIEGIQVSKVCAVCRGDRATTNYKVYRYLDENGKIEDINPTSEPKNIGVINQTTGDTFTTMKHGANSVGRKSPTTLSRKLREGNGICFWADCVWSYPDYDISSLDYLPTKEYRSDAKKVKNLTTGEVYQSITSVGRNYRNLATALRMGNGKCTWVKQEWEILK